MARRLILALYMACGPVPPDDPGSADDSSGGGIDVSPTTSDSASETGAELTDFEPTTSTGTMQVFPPVCGDGVVDPGEECDDLGPFCVACIRDQRVFVTSISFDPFTLAGDGLEGADWICSVLAQQAGLAELGDDDAYQAWLSTWAWNGAEIVNAIDRLVPGTGRYVLVDGTPIAQDFVDLVDGQQLDHAWNLDENGTKIRKEAVVWTGTSLLGEATDADCLNWSSVSPREHAVVGLPNSIWNWTVAGQRTCDEAHPVYCLERG